MDSIYNTFSSFLNYICINNDISTFKNNEACTYVLEHVSREQGLEYLSLIKKHAPFTEEDIAHYCNMNDKIGGGIKHNYEFIKTSPTNFRYIFHSYLILNHLNKSKINSPDICEIGGGYGGLCLAINFFSSKYNININSYNIIDLPNVLELQKRYIRMNNNLLNVNYYSSFNYGSEIESNNLFVISNYCFSEISNDNQQKYITTLFPKVSHGFMVWNHIPVYDFGFMCDIEEEYPKTGSFNKYIYF